MKPSIKQCSPTVGATLAVAQLLANPGIYEQKVKRVEITSYLSMKDI